MLRGAKRKYTDEQLIKLHQDGLPDTRIARKLRVTRSSICYRRKLLGLPPHYTILLHKQIDKDEFWRLYKMGLSDAKIAQKMGLTSKYRIRYFRTKQGFPSNRIATEDIFPKIRKEFEHLWRGGYSGKVIAATLGISLPMVYTYRKRLGLKRRTPRARVLQERCYGYRRLGLSDEEIADKLEMSLARVRQYIGRALMRRCRVEPQCPYKPLLPEYEDNLEKVKDGAE